MQSIFELDMDIAEFEAVRKIRWERWRTNNPQFCCGAIGHFKQLPDGTFGGGSVRHRREHCGREEEILLQRRIAEREFALLARKESRRM